MGLTAQQVLDITYGWRNTTAMAIRAVAAAGGWVWQSFTEGPDNRSDVDAACVAAYSNGCKADSSLQTHITNFKLTLANKHSPGSMVDPERDVARFLLLRGPVHTDVCCELLVSSPLLTLTSSPQYAYLGTSWVGCVGEGTHRHSNEVRTASTFSSRAVNCVHF